MKNRSVTALLTFTLLSNLLSSQELKLGDSAPELRPYEWIKGGPIDEFKNGKVYIVEMGATWCKPCAAAIPMLNELSKKYQGQVEVVSIFVHEINREPLDTTNPEYVQVVRKYVANRGERMDYNVAVDSPNGIIERTWINAFEGGRGVPQTFIVGKEGKIVAHFTGIDQSLEIVLKSILDGSYSIHEQQQARKRLMDEQKKERYNYLKPLFIDNNGGDQSDFSFRSILAKFKKEGWSGWPTSYIRSWHSVNRDSTSELFKEFHVLQGRVDARGSSIDHLYYLAYADTLENSSERRSSLTLKYPDHNLEPWFKTSYGEYWPTPILEVSDETFFEYDFDSPENRWSYALTVPDKKRATAAYLQKLMREDLKRYFGYEVSLETRDMPVWYLKTYPRVVKLKTKTPGKLFGWREERNESGELERVFFNNRDTRDLTGILSKHFNSIGVGFSKKFKNLGSRFDAPFLDMTGIDYELDCFITQKESKGLRVQDFEEAKKFLDRLGFYLEKGTKPMKVVVIRDPKDGILGPALKENQNTQ